MKKEICFFLPELSAGGAERVVCNLANYYVSRGYKVYILLIQNRICEYSLDKNVEIIVLPNNKSRFFKIFTRIKFVRRFLKTHKNCVLVSFLFRALMYAWISTRFIKNKWIVSERNDPNQTPLKPFHRFLRTTAFNFAEVCVFQTEDAKNCFHKKARKRGVVIPNPIYPIEQKRISNQSKIIVNACRLVPQKNLRLLIDAFVIISKEFPEYKLKIYGEGPEKQILNKYISDNKLSQSVTLEGFCSNINEVFREAELFVSSSNYEGISNTMIEAMEIGVPVICTDCPIGGAKMMIDNRVNGILVPVGNKQSMIDAIRELILNKDFAEKLARNAIKRCEKFRLENIAEKWLRVIEG